MGPSPGKIGIGDALPDIRLRTPQGGELVLADLRGRPLVIVCIRYYG